MRSLVSVRNSYPAEPRKQLALQATGRVSGGVSFCKLCILHAKALQQTAS